MAGVFNNQGRHAEALVHNARALAIYRDVLGERHPDTATIDNNNMAIACTQWKQCRHAEALEYYAKALAIRRDVLGERHPTTAATYTNMASVFTDQGRHAEALEYHAKALAIKRDVLGERHPSTGNTYYSMANIHKNLGDKSQARELFTARRTRRAFLASYGTQRKRLWMLIFALSFSLKLLSVLFITSLIFFVVTIVHRNNGTEMYGGYSDQPHPPISDDDLVEPFCAARSCQLFELGYTGDVM
jgi:tetratricopeptide (TPR) repeat protein